MAVGKHRGYEYARSAQPHRARARDVHRVARERGLRARLRQRPRGRGRDAATLDLVITCSSRPTPTAARSGSSRACTSGRPRRGPRSTSANSARSSRPGADDDPPGVDRDADQSAAVDRRHRRGGRRSRTSAARCVVVDNTFATPYLQHPLELGADIVGALDHEVPGRSLRCGRRLRRGSTTTSSPTRCAFLQNAAARCRHRSTATRAARREDLARPHGPPLRQRVPVVAEMLARARSVSTVLYPGLAEHPRPRQSRRGRCATSAGWCRSSRGRRGRRARRRGADASASRWPSRRRGRIADRAPGTA